MSKKEKEYKKKKEKFLKQNKEKLIVYFKQHIEPVPNVCNEPLKP